MQPQDFFQFIEEVQGCALIMLDADLKIKYWNKGAEQLVGYNLQEFKNEPFDFLYQGNEKFKQITDKLIHEPNIQRQVLHEGWLNTKGGLRVWSKISTSMINRSNGSILGYTLILRDITQQKEREEYLKNVEDMHYRMINEVEDYAILLLSTQGFIQNWNKGAEKLKGYKAEEAVGQNFKVFYTPEDIKNNLPQTLLNIAKVEGRANHEGWRLKKDGSKFWGSVTITALHNDNGDVTGYSKVTRDLTEKMRFDRNQKKYVAELESKNNELEQFVYIASHDLQEPLRTISSFVDLFTEEFEENNVENLHTYLKFIREASDRMSGLIKNLLDYGRLGKEKQISEIDLNETLINISSDLTVLIKSSNATLTIDPLPKIFGHKTEIRQLFQNLISNAIKFVKKGTHPQIHIWSDKKEDYHEFYVQDNGIGIADVSYNKIFMIFKRLHSANAYPGNGIGLANCKKIIELHGGRIWVDSVLEQGSVFHFSIPYKNIL